MHKSAQSAQQIWGWGQQVWALPLCKLFLTCDGFPLQLGADLFAISTPACPPQADGLELWEITARKKTHVFKCCPSSGTWTRSHRLED